MLAVAVNYPVEVSVIIAYLLLMLAIGFIFRNFNRTTGDYFRGGSQATWWLVGVTAFMTGISALSFTGNGGAAFQAGWSVLALYIANVCGLAVQAIFLAPWFRQFRATTFPEVIRERFGPVTQQIYAVLLIVGSLILESIWLLALAIFGSTTLGLPLRLMIPCLGAVSVLYSAIGGKWAVMAAGFVQGLILMVMTVLLTTLCVIKAGGLGGLFHLIDSQGLTETFRFIKPPGSFPGDAYSFPWIVAAFTGQFIFNINAQNSRLYFAVKDGREARKAATLTCLLMILGLVFWFVPPIAARLYYSAEVLNSGLPKPAESAFAIISLHLLPVGLLGMMVVAMFSATMCSMDSGLNGNAAMIINDLLPATLRLFGRTMPSERFRLILSRVVTLFFGATIVSISLYFSARKGTGIFEIMINFGAILGIPTAVPMVLCLFIRKVPGWAVLFSVGCALLPALVALVFHLEWSFQMRTFTSTVCGAIGFVFTRLFWAATSVAYKARVEAFYRKMLTPVNFAEEVGAATDGRQLVLLGTILLVVGGFTLCLLAVRNPISGRVAIGAVATIMLTLGFAMRRSGISKSLG